jgi:putative ABC transport system substrate-binding protein
MHRRSFLSLLGGAMSAAWPLAAGAQQPAMPVIGYLYAGTPEGGATQAAAFRKGLGEAGFVEGRNVRVEYRWGENDNTRMPDLAADLVRRRVTVIAAIAGAASRAATMATKTIPVVFGTGSDPVQLGLVSSLNRPGGNATGFSNFLSQLAAKKLGLLHELLPRATRFAVLNPPGPFADVFIKDLQAAVATIGGQLEILVARNSREIDEGFASAVQKRADALLYTPSPLYGNRRAQIVSLATHYRLPMLHSDRENVEIGGLMS